MGQTLSTSAPWIKVKAFLEFDSALWLFVKTRFWVRKSNLKIIFGSSLIFLENDWKSLVIWPFANSDADSAEADLENAPWIKVKTFLEFDSVLWLFVKTCFRIGKSNFKIIFASSPYVFSQKEPTKFGKLIFHKLLASCGNLCTLNSI